MQAWSTSRARAPGAPPPPLRTGRSYRAQDPAPRPRRRAGPEPLRLQWECEGSSYRQSFPRCPGRQRATRPIVRQSGQSPRRYGARSLRGPCHRVLDARPKVMFPSGKKRPQTTVRYEVPKSGRRSMRSGDVGHAGLATPLANRPLLTTGGRAATAPSGTRAAGPGRRARRGRRAPAASGDGHGQVILRPVRGCPARAHGPATVE